MRVANRLRFALACLLVTGLIAGLATACDGEEEETATATPIAATRTPTVVEVPPQPGDFADYPAAIADCLTAAGGSPSCLDELFAAWDMPTTVPEWAEEYGAVDCAAGDLDGDGEDEYLVRLTDPVATEGRHESEVLIFDRLTTGYEVASERAGLEAEGSWWSDAVILGVRDFNGDGKAEASFTVFSGDSQSCCSMPVFILAWDGQEYHNLTDAGVPVPPPPEDIYFADLEGDGIEELYVVGYTNLTYAWDGMSYVQVAEEDEPPTPSVDIREVDFAEFLGVPSCTYPCRDGWGGSRKSSSSTAI